MLPAWPKRWSSGALLSGVVAGLAAFLLTYHDLTRQPSVLSFELLVAALMLVGAIPVGLLLAGLSRGFVGVARRIYGPWGKADYRELTLVATVGLALTWSLDHLDESMGSRRAILRQMHRHAQDQGREKVKLKPVPVGSIAFDVRVYLPDGRGVTCDASPRTDLASGMSPVAGSKEQEAENRE